MHFKNVLTSWQLFGRLSRFWSSCCGVLAVHWACLSAEEPGQRWHCRILFGLPARAVCRGIPIECPPPGSLRLPHNRAGHLHKILQKHRWSQSSFPRPSGFAERPVHSKHKPDESVVAKETLSILPPTPQVHAQPSRTSSHCQVCSEGLLPVHELQVQDVEPGSTWWNLFLGNELILYVLRRSH